MCLVSQMPLDTCMCHTEGHSISLLSQPGLKCLCNAKYTKDPPVNKRVYSADHPPITATPITSTKRQSKREQKPNVTGRSKHSVIHRKPC